MAGTKKATLYTAVGQRARDGYSCRSTLVCSRRFLVDRDRPVAVRIQPLAFATPSADLEG